MNDDGLWVVGPLGFEQPLWLAVAVALIVGVVFLSRKSISGLGKRTAITAIGARALAIILLCGALARPSYREPSENVAVTAVLDVSRSAPPESAAKVEGFLEESEGVMRRGDLVGLVTVGRDARVQALPGPPESRPTPGGIGDVTATNLEEGVRMGLAVAPEDAANRLLLISDGNETEGSLLAAAQEAKARGVPIDVMPIRYEYEREVIVEGLDVPTTARMGEVVRAKVLIRSTAEATGRLSLQLNGMPVDLDPDSDSDALMVRLKEGLNAQVVSVLVGAAGPQEFEAVFEPIAEPGQGAADGILENNRQLALTFVRADGRTLVLAGNLDEAEQLVRAFRESEIDVDARPATEMPQTLAELTLFDAVVLSDVAAYSLSLRQQELLREYVENQMGGLLMAGGPDSFGAGGWIDSPLAEALPVKLDPPQKRQMPRGALALIMHSCEMPQGNYWGRKAGEAAINNLSRLDFAGVVEFDWQQGGAAWVAPMALVGDKQNLFRAIANLTYGDAPDFNDMMQMAFDGLMGVDAGQRHVIIISDGDPNPPTRALMQKFIDNKISISTMCVFPHSFGASGQHTAVMRRIADQTGGNYRLVATSGQVNAIPDFFFKEAQTIRRTLIWEGDPLTPAIVRFPGAPIESFPSTPTVRGYVVTADREGLSQVTMRGAENDPLLAQWQFGLGRVVVFTSDAGARWATDWLNWAGYRRFWEQHLRWVMRPSGALDARISSEAMGDQTRVVVELTDRETGDRLNGAKFEARVSGPETSDPVAFSQTAPGRYETVVDTEQAGLYTVGLRYTARGPDGESLTGSAQAGITRPYADEHRALTDNEALLRQVAAITGGTVREPVAPGSLDDSVWSRAGLDMPVALTPAWLIFLLSGIAVFLADVGVRRVRIDPAIVLKALRSRGVKRDSAKAAERLSSLQQARSQAQKKMQRRAKASDEGEAPARARRFEASAEQLQASEEAGSAMEADRPAPQITIDSPAKRVDTAKGKAGDGGEDEGLSRLLQAKRRAQQDLNENDTND